jgi:hypothetical protein
MKKNKAKEEPLSLEKATKKINLVLRESIIHTTVLKK